MNYSISERLIHSVKTVIAMLLGYTITQTIGIYQGQWIVITIAIVMCAQLFVGSVIHRSYLRFLGTLAGCFIGSSALFLFGASTLVCAITVAIAGFIFSFIGAQKEAFNYASTLGVVTTCIIMVNPHPTVTFAIERFLEISLGILIATLVSQFILPIHARTYLRKAQIDALQQLRDLYQLTLCINNSEINYNERDETLISLLSTQRKLAIDSAKEPLGTAFNKKLFADSLTCEREILRSIDFMHHALIHLQDSEYLKKHSLGMKTFNREVLDAFDRLIQNIQTKIAESTVITLPSLTNLKNSISIYPTNTQKNEEIYLNGYLFSAEILLENLFKLAAHFNIAVPADAKSADGA